MVAILLGLLVYMTWRSNTAFWSSGTAPSELPKAVPAPSSEPPVAAEPSTATRTPAAATARPAPKTNGPATAPTTSAVESQNPTDGSQEKNQTADRRAAERGAKQQPAPRAATTGSVTDEQNGSEELAAAEKYLNAGPGTARDSRQAATWLWKAVAKQNLTATLLLSDLYLRGDGVTKSCDQAHLLLDAAARKGASAAGERLRNLQAFGCR
jgi:TPR repeat protein